MTQPLRRFSRHVTMTSSAVFTVEIAARDGEHAEELIRERAAAGRYDSYAGEISAQSGGFELSYLFRESDDENGEELADEDTPGYEEEA